MKLRLLLIVLAGLGLEGCASITRGTTDTVQFSSDPSGATVKLSNGYGCPSTPCQIPLPRKTENLIVVFEKPGCETLETNISSETTTDGSVMLAGNLIFGGIVGGAVDLATGANRDIADLRVKLEC